MADPANSGSSVKDCGLNNSVTQVDLGICIKDELDTRLQPFQDNEMFGNFEGVGNSLKEEVISSDINQFEVGKNSLK